MTAARHLTTPRSQDGRAWSRAGRVALLSASAAASLATLATAGLRSSESDGAILLLVAAAAVAGGVAGYVLTRRRWPAELRPAPTQAGSRAVVLLASLAVGVLAGLLFLLVGPILGAPPGTLIALAPLVGLAGGEFLMWVARSTPSRLFLAALVIVLALLVLAAIAANIPNSPAIGITASLSGTDLIVEGATDLPDGAELWVSAQVPNQDPEDSPSQKVQVANGRYSATFDTADLPGEDFFVSATFMTVGQPDAIQQRYGSLGENLRGPDVLDGSGVPYVAVTTVISR